MITFRLGSAIYTITMEKSHGDCTNYEIKQVQFVDYYSCEQEGIHFHCTKDPEIELEWQYNEEEETSELYCPKCKNTTQIDSIKSLRSRCEKMLNIEVFKDATLIRLDDWYVNELRKKVKNETDYFITVNVKTDKDGDTIIVIYIGYKGDKEKVQYFIKPEKGQLTSDHKDLDPGKIISKIEVTLKDKKITQEYE